MIRRVFKPTLKRVHRRLVRDAQDTGVEPVLPPDIRFHDVRHTHATTVRARGHSLKAVSPRLGHARVEITLRVYAHVLPTEDAALAEGLNRMFGSLHACGSLPAEIGSNLATKRLDGRQCGRKQNAARTYPCGVSVQATEETRTLNPRFTKAVLCRLSYGGEGA